MRSLFLLCAALLLCACISGPAGALKPTGERASVLLRDESEIEGELVCLADSSLCLLTLDKFVFVPFANIEKIRVPEFDNRDTKALLGIPMILLDLLVAGSVAKDENKTAAVIFGASALLLGCSIAMEPPASRFSKPFEGETLDRLKLYCRYPAGLTRAQWDTLLEQPSPGQTVP